MDAPVKSNSDYKILDCDRQLARDITDYYTKKYFFTHLTNGEISKFRNDTLALLSATDSVSNDMIGIAFKLPKFYYNDLIIDNTVFDGQPSTVILGVDEITNIVVEHKKLSFLTKIDASTKRDCGVYHYWFKDELGNRVQIEYSKSDPMSNVWEKMISAGDVVVKGALTVRNLDGRQHYQLKRASWKVL